MQIVDLHRNRRRFRLLGSPVRRAGITSRSQSFPALRSGLRHRHPRFMSRSSHWQRPALRVAARPPEDEPSRGCGLPCGCRQRGGGTTRVPPRRRGLTPERQTRSLATETDTTHRREPEADICGNRSGTPFRGVWPAHTHPRARRADSHRFARALSIDAALGDSLARSVRQNKPQTLLRLLGPPILTVVALGPVGVRMGAGEAPRRGRSRKPPD